MAGGRVLCCLWRDRHTVVWNRQDGIFVSLFNTEFHLKKKKKKRVKQQKHIVWWFSVNISWLFLDFFGWLVELTDWLVELQTIASASDVTRSSVRQQLSQQNGQNPSYGFFSFSRTTPTHTRPRRTHTDTRPTGSCGKRQWHSFPFYLGLFVHVPGEGDGVVGDFFDVADGVEALLVVSCDTNRDWLVGWFLLLDLKKKKRLAIKWHKQVAIVC